MIDFRLQVFRAVAEMRSLTRAAKALHLSQPAVTKHIKLLEDELKVPLFVRSSSGVTLTDAGTVFLQHVREAEAARAQVLDRLRSPMGQLTGRLSMGSSLTVAAYYLPDVLVKFKSKHTTVTCDVIEGNTDMIIGLLLDQRIQLGLVEGPCRRREIQARPFFQDKLIWIAAPSHRLARMKRVSVGELIAEPVILRELGSGTRRVMETALRQGGIPLTRLRILQELPNTEAIKRMVAAGAGIGCVSFLSVEQELATGKLVRLPCPRLEIKRPFSILIPQGPDPVGIVQTFARFLSQN